MYVTAHIHDRLCAERKQLPHERLVTSLAWRVDDERGALGGKVADGVEDLRCVAGTEGDFVCETVELRVVRGESDRVGGELDAGDLGEVRGESEREKPGAAVGVYEMGWWWRWGAWRIRGRGIGRGHGGKDGVANIRSERDEHRVVILEERTRLIIEEQVADAFPDGRFVICDAEVIVFSSKLRAGCRGVATRYLERVAEQEGDAFFIRIYLSVPPIQREKAWANLGHLLYDIVAHWGISLIQH